MVTVVEHRGAWFVRAEIGRKYLTLGGRLTAGYWHSSVTRRFATRAEAQAEADRINGAKR